MGCTFELSLDDYFGKGCDTELVSYPKRSFIFQSIHVMVNILLLFLSIVFFGISKQDYIENTFSCVTGSCISKSLATFDECMEEPRSYRFGSMHSMQTTQGGHENLSPFDKNEIKNDILLTQSRATNKIIRIFTLRI